MLPLEGTRVASKQTACANNSRAQILAPLMARAPLPSMHTDIIVLMQFPGGTLRQARRTNTKCSSDCGDNMNKSDKLQTIQEWGIIATTPPQQATTISETSRPPQLTPHEPWQQRQEMITSEISHLLQLMPSEPWPPRSPDDAGVEKKEFK